MANAPSRASVLRRSRSGAWHWLPAVPGGAGGPAAGPTSRPACRGDHLPAVTAFSSSSDSRMSCGRSCWLVWLIQRSNAILKTAIPASAARLAAGSLTPRRRSVPASAEARDASLISSRSCSSAFAAMTAWRCREYSRPEERSLREPRPLGDLRHRGLLEPALAVESQGCLLQPAARVWLPSTHAPIVADDSG